MSKETPVIVIDTKNEDSEDTQKNPIQEVIDTKIIPNGKKIVGGIVVGVLAIGAIASIVGHALNSNDEDDSNREESDEWLPVAFIEDQEPSEEGD